MYVELLLSYHIYIYIYVYVFSVPNFRSVTNRKIIFLRRRNRLMDRIEPVFYLFLVYWPLCSLHLSPHHKKLKMGNSMTLSSAVRTITLTDSKPPRVSQSRFDINSYLSLILSRLALSRTRRRIRKIYKQRENLFIITGQLYL